MTMSDDLRVSYLEAEAAAIEEEAALVRAYRDYYAGTHPTYLTDRQKEFLALALDYDFRVNYCAPVVDIPAERLQVLGFSGGQDETGAKVADAAWRWWKLNDFEERQDDLNVSALRDGAAFIIVDWDGENTRPRWTVNYAYDGTRGVRLNHHPDTDAVLSATKYWHEHDPDTPGATGTPRKTVYYPGYIERWRSNKDGWELVERVEWVDADGPLGLAVVPFANPGGSELREAVPVQDMINKTALDLVASADTMGFGIYYASGVAPTLDPETGAEDELNVRPGTVIRLSDPQARLGRVEPDDLANLINAVTFWVVQMASVTRTPQYLFQRWGAEPPSGESLKAQEAGLVAKCERKQPIFGNGFEKVIHLSVRLWNTYGDQERLDPEALIDTTWKSPAMRMESEMLDNAKKKQELGIPRSQTWTELGYDQEQVDGFQESADADRQRAMGELVTKMATTGGNVNVPDHEH